ncbi:carboxylesterase family protein [Niabella sp.]|uniref:carboxylesterase/lipase family protein n=1 Tax=Niabella sp. TaxID=1962976 RepID=UPI0026360ACF|nr:carboxylesterase family protein [Niabella sp.]
MKAISLRIFIMLCSSPLLIRAQLPAFPLEVKVAAGWLKGFAENGLTLFRGVPFAAPPVAQLRWKAPRPVIAWAGVRSAEHFAPSPMQQGNPAAGKSEDCLYLNIWTPAKDQKERLPVMVWIYGGGFSSGSAADPWYDGSALARKGVVFVSIAYRVGPLGFLAHPALSAENKNHVSGNYGLLDQIAALQWIQHNIARFGGDPQKVTIFGESAGGISVSMLCASPLAKGLFRGAISQSGGSFGPASIASITYPGENMKGLKPAEEEGERYLEKAGVSTIEGLRNTPADQLPMGWGVGGSSWPVVDGYVIPDVQYKLYDKGRYNDVPVMIGYNSDEGLSFSPGKTPKDCIDAVHKRYGKFADALLKAYPVGDAVVLRSARNLSRDAAFGWHNYAWANLQSRTGKSKVFYYFFDQHLVRPKTDPEFDHGSPHAQDVSYVFQHLDASDPQTSKSDMVISKAMGDYWINFVKYGSPNSSAWPHWPAFTGKKQAVMYFAETPHTGPVPDAPALKVLDQYFKWKIYGDKTN